MKKNKEYPLSAPLISCVLLMAPLLWSCAAIGQQSVHSSGGNANGSGGTASYSVGQVSYTSQVGSTGMLGLGVQQAYELFMVSIPDTVTKGQTNVFPNPSKEYLVLQVDAYRERKPSYRLCDPTGKILTEGEVTSRQTYIDTTELPSGLYMIQVIWGEEQRRMQSHKFIKAP